MHTKTRRSALGLMLLSMLHLQPIHAYQMQKLLIQWGKDKVVNVRQRANVYQTLDRLVRLGLVEIRETIQTGNHPDRIVYAITRQGRETAREWLREMLTSFGSDFPEFPAAVSVLTMLTPAEARRDFEHRANAVRKELARLEVERQAAAALPRLFLLENSYRTALLEAEAAWLGDVVADLAAGSLGWSEEWLRSVAGKVAQPESE